MKLLPGERSGPRTGVLAVLRGEAGPSKGRATSDHQDAHSLEKQKQHNLKSLLSTIKSGTAINKKVNNCFLFASIIYIGFKVMERVILSYI